MKRFSERQGITPEKAIQLDFMDDDLRNSLWNVLAHHCLGPLDDLADILAGFPGDDPIRESFYIPVWCEFFKLPLDSLPLPRPEARTHLRQHFFDIKWYQVYDLVEFCAPRIQVSKTSEAFIQHCNQVLERERSGYRFVGRVIVPITSEIEIADIEHALQQSGPLTPVHTHLQAALELLSNRQDPDYRNSIKESISAVEALCRLIAADSSASLGKALAQISRYDKVTINKKLRNTFDLLYEYTSAEGGIRHASVDDPDCALEEANFMLVVCSAFVNYLLAKAAKADISLISPLNQ